MKKEFEGLSDQQVLQGIEDLVAEKLGWSSAICAYPKKGIVGMIIGHSAFVEMMSSAAEGKANVKKDELN